MVAPRRPPARPDPRLYATLLALPDDLVGEIVNGRLIASPRPATPHAYAMTGLGAWLTMLFHYGRGGPGGWLFLAEPELHLGPHVLSPDLAGWRRSRLPELPSAAFLTLAPDWVCEGISTGTEVFDRAEKMPAYAAHGVKHAWLVDAEAKLLEVFRNDKGTFRPVASHQGNVAVRAEPFQAAELDLGMFWLSGAKPARRRKRSKS